MKKIKAAAVQMNSGKDLKKNLETMLDFVSSSAKQEAEIIVFPEYCFYRGAHEGLPAAADFVRKKALPALNSYAEKYSVCIVAGSAPETIRGGKKFYNTSFVLRGKQKSVKYRKIHLFRALTDKKINESDIYEPGKKNSV
ncbi:hypothetical protein KKH42_04245, partial [bacterium]|nr:hypothetical protein [bacterium]